MGNRLGSHAVREGEHGRQTEADLGERSSQALRDFTRPLPHEFGTVITVPPVSSGARPSVDVTPNRRGARSREAVLDAAERLMAEQGYEAATVAAWSRRLGVPASSVYHYFGSKEGVLLAVMERGAQRYLAAVPYFDRRIGSRQEHLQVVVETASSLLERQPDFLRILIVMAAQPMSAGDGRGPPSRQSDAGARAPAPSGADGNRVRPRSKERFR